MANYTSGLGMNSKTHQLPPIPIKFKPCGTVARRAFIDFADNLSRGEPVPGAHPISQTDKTVAAIS
jgi:hypothetical protein